MHIAFLGLGAMGHAMASNLLSAGHTLTVHNRTASKARDLVARGALYANTPAEAAKDADIVFSMLFDDHATQIATFGTEGLAQTLKPDAVHVCCSTLSLEQARTLRDTHAERGQRYATATVLGRPPAAIAAQLFVITAGAPDVLDTITPALNAIGHRTFRAGADPAHANLAKLALNFLIMSTIEQMSEVFTITEKAGFDPKFMFEIMTGSFYNAPVHKNYGSLMVERAYDNPGAPVAIGLKDTELFLAAGHDLDVTLPYANIARDRFLSAIANGDAERDFVVIQERARADAGLKR